MNILSQETATYTSLNKLFNSPQLLLYIHNEYEFASLDNQIGISIKDINLNIKQCKDVLKLITNAFNLLRNLKESELKKLEINSISVLNLIDTDSEEYQTSTDVQKKSRYSRVIYKIQELNKLLYNPIFLFELIEKSNSIETHGKINLLLNESKNINDEAKKNAKTIEDLIPSATANSLSNELNTRVKGLVRRTNAWLIFILILLIGTFSVSLDYYKNTESPDFSIEFLLLRLIIFLPIFYLIIFSIRQYNKDRKLLEIYIHKKSIAQTLPAYMAQASNEEISNEILLRGTSVIYTHPENPDIPVPSTEGIPLKEVKSLLEIVSKH